MAIRRRRDSREREKILEVVDAQGRHNAVSDVSNDVADQVSKGETYDTRMSSWDISICVAGLRLSGVMSQGSRLREWDSRRKAVPVGTSWGCCLGLHLRWCCLTRSAAY